MVKQDEIKENARMGYQVATNLMVYEGETLWSKFNALLVANSIVLASIGLSMTAPSRLAIFSEWMPFAGIVLCAFWFLLTKRSFEFYNYWISSAREIEERHLSDSVQTISRGRKFADGEEVKIKIDGKETPLQMSFWGKLFRVSWASYLIIFLFFVTYIILIIKS